MLILNSSGLVVQVQENVPTVPAGAFGTPFLPQGSVGDLQVSTKLSQAVSQNSGYGAFDLGSKVTGIRGSVLVSYVASDAGSTRGLMYLTDDALSPTRRIVLSVDALNRPELSIRDYFGAVKASVMPTIAAIKAGSQNQVLLSWDSTQAIDGTRFAIFRVNSGAMPTGDWVTNPVAAWTSFIPTTIVLGYGVGGALDFNGQLLSVQVSNDTVAGGSGSGGQFPTTHVFDRVMNDSTTTTTT